MTMNRNDSVLARPADEFPGTGEGAPSLHGRTRRHNGNKQRASPIVSLRDGMYCAWAYVSSRILGKRRLANFELNRPRYGTHT